MDLTGKRVLITAAGQGIGFTTARLFAAAGAEVIASDINLERLQGCAGIRALTLNVTDPAAIAAAAEAIGPIDVCSTAPAWCTADRSSIAAKISGRSRSISTLPRCSA